MGKSKSKKHVKKTRRSRKINRRKTYGGLFGETKKVEPTNNVEVTNNGVNGEKKQNIAEWFYGIFDKMSGKNTQQQPATTDNQQPVVQQPTTEPTNPPLNK